jgi:hypothetical protein
MNYDLADVLFCLVWLLGALSCLFAVVWARNKGWGEVILNSQFSILNSQTTLDPADLLTHSNPHLKATNQSPLTSKPAPEIASSTKFRSRVRVELA